MFRSATLQLTAWYAGILMIISILFSIVIYQISLTELDARITHFQGLVQTKAQTSSFLVDANGNLREGENKEASETLLARLVYLNIVILGVGTLASYFLARHTLRPVEEAHEAQARFVSDTSHELRTPLAVMKSELEVSLRDTQLTKDELRDILKSNLEEVESLSRMSEMLLAMSQLDNKRLVMQALDLKLIASEAMYRFRQPKTRLQVTGKGVEVIGNETSLMELFSILIDNALKYSPATTKVSVVTASTSTHAVVSVTNSGNGIPKEALAHVFERFYRVDSSRNASEQKGFGLGLAIAQQIAKAHSAQLTVTSTPKGKTTFTYSQPKVTR